MTAAGELRQRLTFQSLTVGQDSYGGITESWLPIIDPTDPAYNAAAFEAATVWAEVEYLSGRELWQAQQANSEASGRVRMRYRSDIVPTMRIAHGSKYLEIISVLPADNKGRELELLFKEWL